MLHPGMIMGSNFKGASLLYSELGQKMSRDSEIQELAGIVKNSGLIYLGGPVISKGAKMG